MIYVPQQITDDGDVEVRPAAMFPEVGRPGGLMRIIVQPTARILDRDEVQRLRDACDEALS